jgi:hypothetical protein
MSRWLGGLLWPEPIVHAFSSGGAVTMVSNTDRNGGGIAVRGIPEHHDVR